VVERHQHEPDCNLQQRCKPADEQDWDRGLHIDHVEIAVEQRAFLDVAEKRVLGVDRNQRNFRHHARVKPPREQFEQVNAQRVDQAGNGQQHEQRQRQHHQRRGQSCIGDGVDQHLHRNRGRERQQADAHAIDCGEPIEIRLWLQDIKENPEEFG
jgi:hypothetical protein